jgi:hypothetical protein
LLAEYRLPSLRFGTLALGVGAGLDYSTGHGGSMSTRVVADDALALALRGVATFSHPAGDRVELLVRVDGYAPLGVATELGIAVGLRGRL